MTDQLKLFEPSNLMGIHKETPVVGRITQLTNAPLSVIYDPAVKRGFTVTPLQATDQSTRILGHLLSGATITPMQALKEYGCFRLGARIWELKKDGYDIARDIVDVGGGKRVARYRLSRGEK